jgi:hypothetical protein
VAAHKWLTRRDLGLMTLIGLQTALYQVCFLDAIARTGVQRRDITAFLDRCFFLVIVGKEWLHYWKIFFLNAHQDRPASPVDHNVDHL